MPPAVVGGGRVHRDPGRGREEGRERAGRRGRGGQASSAEAEQMGFPGSHPAVRHVGRCGDPSASRAGAPTGRRRRCPARAFRPPGAPTPSALSAVAFLSYVLTPYALLSLRPRCQHLAHWCTQAQLVIHLVCSC